MKKLFLYLLCALGFLSGFAQEAFSVRNHYGYPACIFSGIQCADSSCMITGMLAVPESNFYPVKTFNVSIDYGGNLIDSTSTMGEHNKDYWSLVGYQGFASSPNKQWAVTGYTFSFDSGGIKVLFLAFDSTTQTVVSREFSDSAGIRYASGTGIAYQDGAWFVLANTQDTFDNVQLLLLKIDSLGNLLWKKHYGLPVLWDVPGSIIPISNNRLLIGYCRNNLSTWTGNGPLQTRAIVMMIDSAGNQIGEWKDNWDSTLVPRGLKQTLDGGYVFVTDHKRRTNRPDIFTNQVVIKLDSNLNLMWRREFGPEDYQSGLFKIVELEDSSLVLSGTIWESDGTFYNSEGWFLKIGADGDSIWSRKYAKVNTNFSENAIYDFEVLPDGSLLGVGQSIDRNAQSQGQQGWIIRVDSMGCLIPGCDTALLISVLDPDKLKFELQLYPNPATDVLYFVVNAKEDMSNISVELLSLEGKTELVIDNISSQTTYMLNTNWLAGGMYFLNIKQHGVSIGLKKVILLEN